MPVLHPQKRPFRTASDNEKTGLLTKSDGSRRLLRVARVIDTLFYRLYAAPGRRATVYWAKRLQGKVSWGVKLFSHFAGFPSRAGRDSGIDTLIPSTVI